jgi:hypothetical protein
VIDVDLSDVGFSKLDAKESKFSNDSTKYDLSPEKFENYNNKLIQKVNRMHSLYTMSAKDDSNNACEILQEYTKLNHGNINTARVS